MYCNYVINVIVIGNSGTVKPFNVLKKFTGPFPPPRLEISRSDFGRKHVSDEIFLGSATATVGTYTTTNW